MVLAWPAASGADSQRSPTLLRRRPCWSALQASRWSSRLGVSSSLFPVTAIANAAGFELCGRRGSGAAAPTGSGVPSRLPKRSRLVRLLALEGWIWIVGGTTRPADEFLTARRLPDLHALCTIDWRRSEAPVDARRSPVRNPLTNQRRPACDAALCSAFPRSSRHPS